MTRHRGVRAAAAALAGAALLAPLVWGAGGAAAQAQQPKLTCNSSVDWQITWPATNVPPATQSFPFDGVTGQVVSIQFTTRGPLWYNDHLTAQLYTPTGAVMWPDFNGYYLLPADGAYSVGVYGFVNTSLGETSTVPQRTTMPYSIGLRCTAPPATPTPLPAPPPAPTATATPEG